MSNDTDDPSSPSSALSKKARLAHWITGGTNRGPSTMSSFIRMTRDRNDVQKATKAWSLARESGLNEHHDQWGRPGLPGALDQARGAAPRPRGAALIRWFRDGGSGGGNGGDGHETDHRDAVRQPETHQQERQGQEQTEPTEDDIYGAGDDTNAPRDGSDDTGDSDTVAGRATGEGVQQQQTGR